MIRHNYTAPFLICSLVIVLAGLLAITANAQPSGLVSSNSRVQYLESDTVLVNSTLITLTPQAYLPIILQQGCAYYNATVYASSNVPIAKAGEQFTITAALVNDGCAGLGKLSYSVTVESGDGIVAQQRFNSLSAYLKPNQYDIKQFGFAITQTGQFTITPAVSFEANYGGMFGWGAATSMPSVIRILPNQ